MASSASSDSLVCPMCGGLFVPFRSDQRCCSMNCENNTRAAAFQSAGVPVVYCFTPTCTRVAYTYYVDSQLRWYDYCGLTCRDKYLNSLKGNST